MKVLTLGLDDSIFDKNSKLAKRTLGYGGLVEKFTVIAPARGKTVLSLSENIKAYGVTGGNKFSQLIKIYYLAKIILRQESYSVISVQDPYYLAVVGVFLAKKYKLGLELQIHGWEKFSGLRRMAALLSIKKASSLRVVSQRLKKQLIEQFGINERKITVVSIFSEPQIKSAGVPGESRKKNKNVFVFLTVGRLVPVKNISLQIEAIAEVIKKYPTTELHIIGDGLDRAKLEKLCYTLSIAGQIKFLGWQDNLAELYNAADAFVLTSNYEGWGLAVIEAAGFGLPIIMTDVGCAGEIIKNGLSGLIIPVGDKKKLVDAMFGFIKDDNIREKLGVNAKMAVSQLPSKRETLELYKKSWGIAVSNKL